MTENTFSELMTRLYNQIAEIKSNSLLPYYLFLSKDTYDILRINLPRTIQSQGVSEDKLTLQFIENLEVVVFVEPYTNYLVVKGIKINVPEKTT